MSERSSVVPVVGGSNRASAVLIPLFSVRCDTGWGVGEIGDLPALGRWARKGGFSALQLLPVHEVARGESSPYSAVSAFALDPAYLSLGACEDFQAAGGDKTLTDHERALLSSCQHRARVDWEGVRALKTAALRRAHHHFATREWATDSSRARGLRRFAEENSWVSRYALAWALAERHGRNWRAWPAPLATRQPEALAEARREHADAIAYRTWLEWVLTTQWQEARRELASTGIELWGDLAFVVSTDAADVWEHQDLFRLDVRAGAPPDPFSVDGQDWGLPVYDWTHVAETDWAFFRERAQRSAALYAACRVDHVVGLYRTYHFRNDGGPPGFSPAREDLQLANGEAALGVLGGAGCRVIAEDLGVIPDFVRASLQRLGIPGYRVQRWEKDDSVFRDPASWPVLSVATTGTHDTEALAEWFEALPRDERRALWALPTLRQHTFAEDEAWSAHVRDALLAMVYAAPSADLVIPFPDLFGWRDRINVPGTVGPENWTWRMPEPVSRLGSDRESIDRLAALARAHRRG